MPVQKYHWKRDDYDSRDHYICSSHRFSLVPPESIPSSVDLLDRCSPVFDQGPLGSCTANALVGACEYLENKYKDFEVGDQFANLSRLFVYWNERKLENCIASDGGAQISDGIKVLSSVGVCIEDDFPYDIDTFSNRPTETAFKDAEIRKISAYARVPQDLVVIKQTLSSGYPIVFGFIVYPQFESQEMANTGFLRMPRPGERNKGGHAVLAIGYDDQMPCLDWEGKQVCSGCVKVRNSWGPDWGIKGNFWMPYSYFLNNRLVDDLWTIRK
jgi:C1A family cysteine protease